MNKNKNSLTQKYNTRKLSSNNSTNDNKKVLVIKNGKVVGSEVVSKKDISYNIHQECNKKLSSKSWVSTRNLSNPFPKYHDTQRRNYYLRHIGNFWYEIPKDNIRTIKEEIKEKEIKKVNKKVREITEECVVTTYNRKNLGDCIKASRLSNIIKLACG